MSKAHQLVLSAFCKFATEAGLRKADTTVLVLGGDQGVVGGAVAAAGYQATFVSMPLSNAGDADWATQIDSMGRKFDACIVEEVVGPAFDVGALLSRIHGWLKPDGFLGLVADNGRKAVGGDWPKDGGSVSGRPLSVETLSALLFREGFTSPALRRAGAGRLAVAAHRSRLARPCDRTLKLSVVMPVFNEIGTFREVVTAVLGKTITGIDIELIIVESNSTDGTRREAQSFADHPRVLLILQERPRGKGFAARAGLAAATGDFVLIQDADLEYDIADYEQLLEPLRRFERAFVLGRRTSAAGSGWKLRRFAKQAYLGHAMNIGHLLFAGLFNLVFRQRLQDPFTMFKVFRRDCLHGLTFECERFDFDWELVAKLIRAGFVPLEIPVRYQSRSFAEGKKVSLFGDPLTWIVTCFKCRFVRLYE